jgi:hypothetical protein
MQSILDIPQHGDGNAVTIVGQPAFARRHPFLNAVVQEVRDIIAGSREGLAMQDRYETLSRLSDWELARRRLTRADIKHLVVNGEKGRRMGGNKQER